MLKFLKKVISLLFKHRCKYCNQLAVVKCIKYNRRKVYMCSDCINAFRFREKECFKSVLPY